MWHCQKAGQKLNAISRITPYMDFAKRRLLINAFFYSQFNYCQFVWMCHNRTNNSKINRLHERCLRLIYNDKKSSFKDILERDGSVSIHHINLRTLGVKLCKVFIGLNLVIFVEAFPVKQQSQYNMVNHGLESLSYIGSKLWDSISSHMKEINSVNEFKHFIKTWKPGLCLCSPCKVYLHNIGYLQ